MFMKNLQYNKNAYAIILNEKNQKTKLHIYYVLRHITTRFKTYTKESTSQSMLTVVFLGTRLFPSSLLLYISQQFSTSIF